MHLPRARSQVRSLFRESRLVDLLRDILSWILAKSGKSWTKIKDYYWDFSARKKNLKGPDHGKVHHYLAKDSENVAKTRNLYDWIRFEIDLVNHTITRHSSAFLKKVQHLSDLFQLVRQFSASIFFFLWVVCCYQFEYCLGYMSEILEIRLVCYVWGSLTYPQITDTTDHTS